MDGAFTTTTEDIYRSNNGKITITLTCTNIDQPELRVRIDNHNFILSISDFDEVVSAVEVLQDRARARRSGR